MLFIHTLEVCEKIMEHIPDLVKRATVLGQIMMVVSQVLYFVVDIFLKRI